MTKAVSSSASFAHIWQLRLLLLGFLSAALLLLYVAATVPMQSEETSEANTQNSLLNYLLVPFTRAFEGDGT